MISIVNTECHVPKTFSDLAKIAAWGRLGLIRGSTVTPSRAADLQQFPMQQCVIAQLVTKRAKCADCQPAHMLWQQRSD